MARAPASCEIGDCGVVTFESTRNFIEAHFLNSIETTGPEAHRSAQKFATLVLNVRSEAIVLQSLSATEMFRRRISESAVLDEPRFASGRRPLRAVPCYGARSTMSLRPALLACVFGFTCLRASQSQAAPGQEPRLYLQLSTGVGVPLLWSSADFTDVAVEPPLSATARRNGFSLLTSLFLGVSLHSRLALGVGGIASVALLTDAKVVRSDGAPVSSEDTPGNLNAFAVLGPFIDYYPKARSGFHVQGLLGLGAIGNSDLRDGTPTGLGLAGGVGQDWSVSEHWSIGMLARVTFVATRRSDTFYPARDYALMPSLEATFAYH